MSIPTPKLTKLAKKYADVDTIYTRYRDGLDFYDVHISNIVAMIQEAYEMGKKDALDKQKHKTISFSEPTQTEKDNPMYDEILKERFGNYGILFIDDGSDEYSDETLVQIVHENIVKDVWINQRDGKINMVVDVYPSMMSDDEMKRFQEYQKTNT